MATLKTNTLTGTTTAGSIAVTGEGNSTTTNLQQGLAKAWVKFQGTSTAAINDSFNITGITDQGTGQYQFALANQNAINDAAQFGAGAQNQFAMQNQQQLNAFQLAQATGAADIQESKYAQATDAFGISSGRKMAADNARKQATSDALGGLTSIANIGAKAAMMSDRRLKKDIKLIGYSSSGLKIYNFKYKSKPDNIYQGVMSDEIPSHAVIKHSSGFDWVDYSLLDVEFKLID